MCSSEMTLNYDLDREYLPYFTYTGTLTLCKGILEQYNGNEILTYVNHLIQHKVLMKFNNHNHHINQSFNTFYINHYKTVLLNQIITIVVLSMVK
jgi:hypothetical protein